MYQRPLDLYPPVAQGGAAAVVVDGLRRGLDPVGDVVHM
jgi:hypothetical protein